MLAGLASWSKTVTHTHREHIGVELDVDVLPRRQCVARLDEGFVVGKVYKPAVVQGNVHPDLRRQAESRLGTQQRGVGRRSTGQAGQAAVPRSLKNLA